MLKIRPYHETDEYAWLHCRLLSFFHTDYYDDVWTQRPLDDQLEVALIALDEEELVGLIDITTEDNAATIDTLAVQPDVQRRGIGTTLLHAAISRLPDTITTLDAWTRDDQSANAWYRSRGFAENDRYLHVYKSWDESDDGFAAPDGLSAPVSAFLHAPMEREPEMRERFRRVHVCRQYVLMLPMC